MSVVAVDKAGEVHRRYPQITVPVDMDWLAEAEGCKLIDWPFLAPVKEVKRGRWIGIAQGVSCRERRHLIAHALGHHLLHCGNQLAFHQQGQAIIGKQEREAEVFAAHLLMPSEKLAKLVKRPLVDIAEIFDVPEELVRHRLNDYALPKEVEYWNKINTESA